MRVVSPRGGILCAALLLLAACGGGGGEVERAQVGSYPNETAELRAMAEAAAARNGVPPDLVRRVVSIESGHRPEAVNGTYVGLMQIDPQTARTIGYRGDRAGLFDAATNLEYGTRYLRGAWIVADGDSGRAYDWYRRGYYYEAKRKGLLEETGLR
jgi:soluble lytic murein transglycosylase-like protein